MAGRRLLQYIYHEIYRNLKRETKRPGPLSAGGGGRPLTSHVRWAWSSEHGSLAEQETRESRRAGAGGDVAGWTGS